ncbi:MAG: hypothetical protein H0T48_06495 [Gemmatimonadaceae bacterium]|nr:hypothetical protein [Gemmatimonadaceae bacterium]
MTVGALEDEFGLELNRPRLGMYPLNAGICEPLTRLTDGLHAEPWLATRSEYRGDNTYRLTLRRGVSFHDGSEFNAKAAKYALGHSVRVKTQYSFLSEESVRVIDDSTVEIRPTLPNLRVIDQLVHPLYGMIAPGSNPVTRPVCTGPFRFVEYVPQSHITVARNDSYWGNKARLQRLTFRFFQDDNTRALALRSGEVDAIFDVSRGMIASLRSVPGISIVMSPPGAVILMYIATRGVPPYTKMSDPAVRRAVALAIDRKVLAENVLEGHAAVVSTVNPPRVLGKYAARVRGIPYDPEEARRILDGAGWKLGNGRVRAKSGKPLELVMITQSGNVDRFVGEYVQAQLAAVGIRVKLDQLDPGAFSSRINSGAFDLDLEVPNQNDANPAFLLALRWYSKSTVKSARFMFAGQQFDSLVTASLTSESRDDAQRNAAEAMHLLVDEEVAAIPLAGIYRIYAMSDKVRGFNPHPSRNNQWWNTVWLAR